VLTSFVGWPPYPRAFIRSRSFNLVKGSVPRCYACSVATKGVSSAPNAVPVTGTPRPGFTLNVSPSGSGATLCPRNIPRMTTLILKKTASHYGGDWADSDFVVLEDDKVNCTRKHLRANRGSGRSRHTSGAHHQPLIVVTVPRASKRWRISRRDGNIRALRWPVLTTTASGHTIDDHARSKNPGRLF
jgi:hypothetical protein